MKAARKPREPKPEKAAAATAVPADLYWLWEFRFDRLFEAGELDKALAESNRAIEQHGDGEAYTARALVYGAMGWVNEGIADCDRALAVDPGYGAAYVVKGRLLSDFALAEAAIAHIDRGIELDATVGSHPWVLEQREDARERLTPEQSKGVIDFEKVVKELEAWPFTLGPLKYKIWRVEDGESNNPEYIDASAALLFEDHPSSPPGDTLAERMPEGVRGTRRRLRAPSKAEIRAALADVYALRGEGYTIDVELTPSAIGIHVTAPDGETYVEAIPEAGIKPITAKYEGMIRSRS